MIISPRILRTAALIAMLALIPASAEAQNAAPDTLMILDAATAGADILPAGWNPGAPGNQRTLSSYAITRSIDGTYLRATSNGGDSWIEFDAGQIDLSRYPVMAWEWKVDRFADVGWEQDASFDDFPLRIELIFDFSGSWVNPINLIRKGLITAVFHRYPPELITSYVWAVNVPAAETYRSPESGRMVVIPVESTRWIIGRWIREKWNVGADLTGLYRANRLVLKKIRIRSDGDNTGGIVESGLRYLMFLSPDGTATPKANIAPGSIVK